MATRGQHSSVLDIDALPPPQMCIIMYQMKHI